MNRLTSRGFSLVELAVTLVVLGLILGFGIPSFQSYNTHHQLKGATENVAAQMRMMREVAIGTGATRTMHFTYGYNPGTGVCDYHDHTNNVMGAQWSLPRNITYFWGSGTLSSYDFQRDGRVYNGTNPASGMIILQDNDGNRDTVSILASGLVLSR